MALQVSDHRLYGLSEHMHHVPWRPGYRLGAGIDVVKGTAARCAVKQFEVAPPSRPHVAFKTEIMLFESEQAIMNAVSFSTSAALACFNLEPLNLRGAAGGTLDSLRSVRRSATSFSLLVLSTKRWADQYGSEFELTADALGHARDDPATFRDVYGDYFIAGTTAGALFTAVLTWTCATRETCRVVEAAVQAELNMSPIAPVQFTSHMGSALDRLAKDRRAHLNIQFGMRGVDSDASMPPTAGNGISEVSQIFQPLAWFQQHAVGETVSALICHYSRVAFPVLLPHALPVGEAVFEELTSIRETLLQCQFRMDSIPPTMMRYGVLRDMRNLCISLANQCADYYQPMLPYDDAKRKRLLADLRSLLGQLQEFEIIQEFFLTVLEKHRGERAGEPLRAREGKTWEYGCPLPSAAGATEFITIHKLEPEVRVVKGWVHHTSGDQVVKIVPRPGEHIVGWTVQSLQSSGSWRKLSRKVTLTREAAIKLRRGLWTTTWEIAVYVIKNPFFDALCQSEPSTNGSTLDTHEGVEGKRPAKRGWFCLH